MAIKTSIICLPFNEINNKSNTWVSCAYAFFKEDFKYLRTNHAYHLVDASPWQIWNKILILFY